MKTSEQLSQEIRLKRERQSHLQESMSAPERKYVKIKAAVKYAEDQLPIVLTGGDEKSIASLQETIQKNKEALQDVLDGKVTVESDPRVMSIREKQEMYEHSFDSKAKLEEFQHENNIKYVTVKDRYLIRDIIPIKDEVLDYVLASDKVKEYRELDVAIKQLKEKYEMIYKKEVEDWKQKQESEIKSVADALAAAWEKAYAKLADVSKKKDNMIAQFGMQEKAALESLSPSERYEIEKEEERVNEIERAQNEISARYDTLKTSEDKSDINDVMFRFRRMCQRYKQKFSSYPALQNLSLLFTIE